MQVKELLAILQKANPEAEVVIQDYSAEFYAGVEEVKDETVFPWDGEAYSNPEIAVVLRQTHESVAADKAFQPD